MVIESVWALTTDICSQWFGRPNEGVKSRTRDLAITGFDAPSIVTHNVELGYSSNAISNVIGYGCIKQSE